MTRPTNLLPTANALFSLMELPALPPVEPVTNYPVPVNLAAFSAEERRWMLEAAVVEGDQEVVGWLRDFEDNLRRGR